MLFSMVLTLVFVSYYFYIFILRAYHLIWYSFLFSFKFVQIYVALFLFCIVYSFTNKNHGQISNHTDIALEWSNHVNLNGNAFCSRLILFLFINSILSHIISSIIYYFFFNKLCQRILLFFLMVDFCFSFTFELFYIFIVFCCFQISLVCYFFFSFFSNIFTSFLYSSFFF